MMLYQYGNLKTLKGTEARFLGLDDIKYVSIDPELVKATASFAFFVEKLAELNKAGSSIPLEKTVADLNQRWRIDPDSQKAWEELRDGLNTYNLLTSPFTNFIQKQLDRKLVTDNRPKVTLQG